MKTYTLNGFEILLPEIPEGATEAQVKFFGVDACLCFKDRNGKHDLITLPPSNWQLYQLESVPEKLAGEMVEWYEDTCDSSYDPMYNVTTRFKVFTDYLKGDDLDTAHASLTSFLRSHGIEGNPYFLIKKN